MIQLELVPLPEPRRRRNGPLSARQSAALDAITQRPRTARELAVVLDCSPADAHTTAESLVRRRLAEACQAVIAPPSARYYRARSSS